MSDQHSPSTKAAQQIALKPCPFCGGDAEFGVGVPWSGNPDNTACYVRCSECRMSAAYTCHPTYGNLDRDDIQRCLDTWNAWPHPRAVSKLSEKAA